MRLLFTQAAHTTCKQLSSMGVRPRTPPQQEHDEDDVRGRQKSKERRVCCVADIFQGWSGGSVPQATVLPRQGRNALIEATDVTERRSYLTAVRKLCVSPTRRRRPACAKCQTKIHSAPFKCRQKYEPTFSKSKVAQVQMTQKIFVHECKSRLPALALLLLALHGCCLSKSAYFCRH